MSKIVFLAMSQGSWVKPVNPDSYTQGFINALARMGNSVTCIILNGFNQPKLNDAVIHLKPDYIFTINHEGISKKILKETNCPIITDINDSLPFLKNLNLIYEYRERYYFTHKVQDTIHQINAVLPYMPKDRNVILGHATDLHRQDIEQDIPISFIGSLSNWDKSIPNYWRNEFQNSDLTCPEDLEKLKNKKDAFLRQMEEYAAAPLDPCSSVLTNPALTNFGKVSNNRNYAQAVTLLKTCNLRYAVLEQLTDLGLRIYSYPIGMVDVISYNIKMFECFDFTPSVTLADAERTFNRSKISINLPHAHVVNGFSWRVPDILASNACLLSDFRPDLKKLMTGYIDIPMYESPAEARELAQKLLKDDVWRKDIVAASQQMIENKCRFEHRLRKLAEKTGLKLECPEEKRSLLLERGEEHTTLFSNKNTIETKKPVSDFTENMFRFIFKIILMLCLQKEKRKYLRKRFSVSKKNY